LGELRAILREATIRATKSAPLRLNAVEVFDEVNTGTNVGTDVPYIVWEIVDDSTNAEIEVYQAGGRMFFARTLHYSPSFGWI
jgi:L(+)-tartrate dehydratase alpha subunit